MLFKSLTVAAAVGAVAAQNASTSICDKYTTALLTNNTAANQLKVLTLVVNTAVIGNYSETTNGMVVDGILKAGMVDGTPVDLLGYFNGTLKTSNRGGDSGVSVNFLDGGGAAPLMKNLAAEDDSSNQYMLLTHLYEYFGGLLGCSQMGSADYSSYDGETSMYEVHKFMELNNAEVQYFITQVANSAASFGVAKEDLTTVGAALNSLFGVKCGPETMVLPGTTAQLQSICIEDDCPTATNASCASYTTNTTSGTPTPTPTPGGNSASAMGMSVAAIAAGLFAAFL